MTVSIAPIQFYKYVNKSLNCLRYAVRRKNRFMLQDCKPLPPSCVAFYCELILYGTYKISTNTLYHIQQNQLHDLTKHRYSSKTFTFDERRSRLDFRLGHTRNFKSSTYNFRVCHKHPGKKNGMVST